MADETPAAKLARLDERSRAHESDIADLKSDVSSAKKDVKENYVSKIQFRPIEMLVYGMTSSVLLAVLGALAALVIKK